MTGSNAGKEKMTGTNPKVSIFTCVYNRADKIHRALDSVRNQTYSNIEHIIIDDGSTDGVESQIRKYIDEVGYPVIFRQKENGGKHTATNLSWSLATGDFIVQLDSDDELLPDAVERLVKLWFEIPEKDRELYWCAQARVKTQNSDEVFGDLYPEGINSLSKEEKRKVAMHTAGEKIGLMKADIIKQYRYPEPKYVKFVSEAVLWRQINKKYQTWYSNDIVRIYYVNEGECLSAPSKNIQTFTNMCWGAKWCLENYKAYEGINLKRELFRYVFFWQKSRPEYKKEYGYLSPDVKPALKILLVLLFVPVAIGALLKK